MKLRKYLKIILFYKNINGMNDFYRLPKFLKVEIKEPERRVTIREDKYP